MVWYGSLSWLRHQRGKSFPEAWFWKPVIQLVLVWNLACAISGSLFTASIRACTSWTLRPFNLLCHHMFIEGMWIQTAIRPVEEEFPFLDTRYHERYGFDAFLSLLCKFTLWDSRSSRQW